jgi:peptide deformylase
MALLEILEYPDPRLRQSAEPVAVVDDAVRKLAADMLETMYAAPGIGLAAIQVNVPRRVIVADVSDAGDAPRVLVNPEVLEADGLEVTQEGCLSVPGFFEEVERAERIRFRALDLHGELIEEDADGLFAVCIQHEIDHLDGKLFVDYLSQLKRSRIRKKLQKSRRESVDHASAPVI